MSHAILGNRFAQQDQRRAPWHGIQGAVYQPGTLVSEGLAQIDGDFMVERRPIYTTVNYMGMEVVVAIPDQAALVRPALADDPEPRVMGIVSDGYELLQHAEVARALDPLVQQGWVLETLGILHEGAQFFSTFHSGGFIVNQDEIESYWVVSEHKGKSSIQIFSAHTRVVCANTYRVAESQALTSLAIPHYQGAKRELDWCISVLAAAQKQTEEMKETLEAFGKEKLARDEARELFENTYLMPPLPRRVRTIQELKKSNPAFEVDRKSVGEMAKLQEVYLQQCDKVQQTREATWERYQAFNEERSDYADTKWAAWNAVTEVENHKNGKQKGQSVLFGSRAETMERAWRLLVA